MVQDVSIAVALLLSGWCLFVRRDTWRCGLGRALTISVLLIAIGIVLTSPMLTTLDTHFLLISVGVQHFDDYLGHLCFISALCVIAYAVLIRVAPDKTARRLMRQRVEYPALAAAIVMLTLITLSPHLAAGAEQRNDFFEVCCGPYLHAYWTVYAATMIYLMGYMIRLLWVLRRDPRSKRTATLYLAAAVLGIIGTLAEFADTWGHFIDGELWLLLTAPAVTASLAAGLSWRAQRPDRSPADTPPATPKITT